MSSSDSQLPWYLQPKVEEVRWFSYRGVGIRQQGDQCIIVGGPDIASKTPTDVEHAILLIDRAFDEEDLKKALAARLKLEQEQEEKIWWEDAKEAQSNTPRM